MWASLKGWCRGGPPLQAAQGDIWDPWCGQQGEIWPKPILDRKSMPSPCQVADVQDGNLETKCFNILTQILQAVSFISVLLEKPYAEKFGFALGDCGNNQKPERKIGR